MQDRVRIQSSFGCRNVWTSGAYEKRTGNTERDAQQVSIGNILMQEYVRQNGGKDDTPSTQWSDKRGGSEGEGSKIANFACGHEKGAHPPGRVS